MNTDGTKGAAPERFGLMLQTGLLALMLVVALSLWLSRFQVRAEPAAEGAAEDVSAHKEVMQETAAPGQILTYTISVTNSGDTSARVWLTDDLPGELSYVSDTLSVSLGTGAAGDGLITWTAEMSKGGSTAALTFAAEISSEATLEAWLTNTVEISSPAQSFTRSIGTYVRPVRYYAYLPLIFRHWPPIPYPPDLDEINNPGYDRDYTVSWSYDDAHPDGTNPVTYTLQEATHTGPYDWRTIHEGPEKSWPMTGRPNGHYYYRVRGSNEFGPGEWSNIEDVLVWQYDDDFSDHKSGWPREWSDTRGALYRVRPDEHPSCPGCAYEGGDSYLIARRKTSQPYATFGPGVAVPSNRYEIEVDTRWWDANWGATYQILFGANESLSEYYAVRVKIDDWIDLCRFSLVRSSDSGTRVLTDGWVDAHDIECGESRGDDTPWNHWRIRRDGDRIRVHVNGEFLGQWRDSTFGANRYFGVRATLYEGFTPSKSEYDNWSVRLLD